MPGKPAVDKGRRDGGDDAGGEDRRPVHGGTVSARTWPAVAPDAPGWPGARTRGWRAVYARTRAIPGLPARGGIREAAGTPFRAGRGAAIQTPPWSVRG